MASSTSTATAAKPDYAYSGPYDHAKFLAEFNKQFGKMPRYNAAAVPELFTLLGFIESDSRMKDVRWAAYMLATVMWETTVPTTVKHQALSKKGVPLVDKNGKPVIVEQRPWLMSMKPVDEVGHGKERRYYEPVKVKLLVDGSVRITEQDGDQFLVSVGGKITPLTKKAVMGSAYQGAESKAYEGDDGKELAYYGRGYVQLTWWSNYVTAGFGLGIGLELLLDPELVKMPEVAYCLMSDGMLTGAGFANGHRFSKYFFGNHTDYVKARQMVNGHNEAAAIAALAVKFETVLMNSKFAPVPATLPPLL